MKRFFMLPIIFFLFIVLVNGQPAKSVYAELGGPGIASLNYDMRFTNREDGIGGRIGIGGFKVEDAGAIFVPIGLNYLIGKDKRHYFEIGGGVTFVSVSDNSNSDNSVFRGTFGHLSLGYRLQPVNGGFLFRAAIVPIFGNGFFLPYYAGIAFGYKF